MSKKSIIITSVVIILIVVIALVGFNFSGGSTPHEATDNFAKAMETQNYRRARACLDKNGKGIYGNDMLQMYYETFFDSNKYIIYVDMENMKAYGNIAVENMERINKITKDTGNHDVKIMNVNLKKSFGRWRISNLTVSYYEPEPEDTSTDDFYNTMYDLYK